MWRLFLSPQSSNSSPLLVGYGGKPILGFDAPQLFSLPPGWAKAGIAMATIIAAMTSATVTNNMMRLISATHFLSGAEEERCKTPAPAC
jgi:hypothetical protein